MSGDMRTEAAMNNNGEAEMHEGEIAAGPEEFNISGSPAKELEEEFVLETWTATPSQRDENTRANSGKKAEDRDRQGLSAQETQHGHRRRHGVQWR